MGGQLITNDMILEELVLLFIVASLAMMLVFAFILPFRRHFLLAIGMLILVPPFFLFWMFAELFSFLFLEEH